MVNRSDIDATDVKVGGILEVTLYEGINLSQHDPRLDLPIVWPKNKWSDNVGRTVVGYLVNPLFVNSNLDDCLVLSSEHGRAGENIATSRDRLMYIRYDCIHSCGKPK